MLPALRTVIRSGAIDVPGVSVVRLQTPVQPLLLAGLTVAPPAEKHSLPALTLSPRTSTPLVIEGALLVAALKVAKLPEPTRATTVATTMRLIRTWCRRPSRPDSGCWVLRAEPPAAVTRSGIAARCRPAPARAARPTRAGRRPRA